jgi:hypothetical protein
MPNTSPLVLFGYLFGHVARKPIAYARHAILGGSALLAAGRNALGRILLQLCMHAENPVSGTSFAFRNKKYTELHIKACIACT